VQRRNEKDSLIFHVEKTHDFKSISIGTHSIVILASITMPMASNENTKALTLFASTALMSTMLSKKYSFSSFVGGIYDKLVVNMTEVWYRRVLEKQTDGSVILDVGIGTAGE
jgi:hypothetical protein